MEKEHLTYFKVENFKRFDSFEMSNLGQFNLIVGDNNVGKTSVLEALTFDTSAQRLVLHFFITAFERFGLDLSNGSENLEIAKQSNFWDLFFKDDIKPIVIKTQDYSISVELMIHSELSEEDKEYIISIGYNSIPQKWLKLKNEQNDKGKNQIIGAYLEKGTYVIDKDIDDAYLTFTPSNQSYSQDMVALFYSHYNNNKARRKELENTLRFFIPKLEELRVHNFGDDIDVLCVTLIDDDGIYPITRFGDGTIKTFRILLEIILAKGKRLMLDEIGAGIHFSRLKPFWKMMFVICHENDVQLFATTHSLECQQAFIEALEDPEMQQHQKDARNISLLENAQGEVKTVTFDFEQFEYAVNIGFNTRGGKV